MVTNIVNLQQVPDPSANDMASLAALLTQLYGEPFRFVRISYGDELTLHFGNLRKANSPKLADKLYGSFYLRRSWFVLDLQVGNSNTVGHRRKMIYRGRIGDADPQREISKRKNNLLSPKAASFQRYLFWSNQLWDAGFSFNFLMEAR